MFSDPLMEDRFRTQKCSQDFLNGYSNRSFTYDEKRRLLWYDIILFLSYEEEQQNGQWLKSITFKLPIIPHDMEMSLDKGDHVERDVLADKLN